MQLLHVFVFIIDFNLKLPAEVEIELPLLAQQVVSTALKQEAVFSAIDWLSGEVLKHAPC